MFGIGMYADGAVLILIWSGLIAAGRAFHPSSWWWMTSGTLLITLGFICRLLIFVIGGFANQPWWNDTYRFLMFCTGYLPLTGYLLFAMGFLMRGSLCKRLTDRITELEMMNLAQAAELERLRNR